jgi:multisubunit Na+/H+ antiporter MnhB subunit
MNGEKHFLKFGGITVTIIAIVMFFIAFSGNQELTFFRITDLLAVLLIGLSATLFGFYGPPKILK